MLKIGAELLNVSDGSRLVVVSKLGRGGQGDVWSVRAPTGVEPVAVKWYHPASATPEQFDRISELVDSGEPNERFLWPRSLVKSAEDPTGFGYVMPIRPDGYDRFDSVIDGRSGQLTFVTLATIGRNLAVSFHALHAAGLCYRDINIANVFVQPTDGEILVCDNDNVSIDGDDSGVRGSMYFMAPEVMRGDSNPSRHSDYFSLAVLLFYLLVRHHPLEGRRCLEGIWDDAAQMRAFALEPLFIFDPDDASNAPDGAHQLVPLDWWPLLPKYVRDLFTRSFTIGLTDPQARVTETVWRDALDDLRASMQHCTCGAANLRDSEAVTQLCWRPTCRAPLLDLPSMMPARPRGRRPLLLDEGATLTRVNTTRSTQSDHRTPVAKVEVRLSQAGERGLRNLSLEAWTFHPSAGGAPVVVDAGRVLRLRSGTLDFGAGHSARLLMPNP